MTFQFGEPHLADIVCSVGILMHGCLLTDANSWMGGRYYKSGFLSTFVCKPCYVVSSGAKKVYFRGQFWSQCYCMYLKTSMGQ